jgi:septum site-determining protein MinC
VALVLAPELPLADWLSDLDTLLERSPGFFRDRAIVIDVTGLASAHSEMAEAIAALRERGIRVLGIEGADAAALGVDLPPAIRGGRPAADIAGPESEAGAKPPAITPRAAPSLVVDGTVRSGQSVVHSDGDVIVIGSVGSGAEVIAGGSIHVYGTLRGRAIAGATGNAGARIFCHKLEAELLAIDGLYKMADDMDGGVRGRPVQARLEGDAIVITALS